jgi:hypothetical protein
VFLHCLLGGAIEKSGETGWAPVHDYYDPGEEAEEEREQGRL